MKNFIVIFAAIGLVACSAQDSSGPLTGPQTCTVRQYTNGQRIKCPGADIVTDGTFADAIVGTVDLCGNGSAYNLYRLEDNSLVNLDGTAIQNIGAGAYSTPDACNYNVGAGPAYNVTY